MGPAVLAGDPLLSGFLTNQAARALPPVFDNSDWVNYAIVNILLKKADVALVEHRVKIAEHHRGTAVRGLMSAVAGASLVSTSRLEVERDELVWYLLPWCSCHCWFGY